MKRLLVLGFVLVLLLAIPLTLFLLGQQTKTRSGASPATNLTFVPSSKNVNVGDAFSLDISLDPGQSGTPNDISFINLVLSYSSNLSLDVTKGDSATPGMTIPKLTDKTLVLLTPESAPQCGASTCTVTISLGVSPNNSIKTIIHSLITLYFNATAAGDPSNPSTISLSGSKVLSIGSGDQPSNNVLLTPVDATINVSAPSITPSPSVSAAPTGTGAPTPTDTPVQSGGGTPTNTPTGAQTTGTPTTTGSLTPTGSANAPVCVSLTVDKLNGPNPLTVNFTASGNDTNGTVGKITYNFGDGKVQDVTSGGGVGTTVVNSQLSHIYNSDGTFTASVTISDTGGSVSDPTTCSKTITVGAGGTVTVSPTNSANPTPTPPIPSSGPGQTIVHVGILGGILSMLGAILIFAL